MSLLFPDDIYPTTAAWRLVPNTEVFKNPFNGTVQTLTKPGTQWQVELSFTNLSRAQAARLTALVAQLRGSAGRIKLWDHGFATPQGTAGGTPVIDGAGQLGSSINIRGCTPSQTFLKAGDYCQIGNQCVLVVADAVADGNGLCTLVVEAPVRYAPTNGSAIITTKASGIFMLKDNNQAPRRSTKKLVLSTMTLAFVEDLST
ncbi:hypothetical protein G3R49_12410 [Shewanella sp. WXL01]|uniref:hypothetical protein n=1 Tax=Shewanella sp. WXL01 TaxID=2709721 RepID=UPI001438625D|nr:hypothetical protein [Shewanella sp. WXL01]NKF51360.1 hypothetical protein [Shewanella sp. WXL01]